MTRLNSRNFHIPDFYYKMALLGGNHKNMEIHPMIGSLSMAELENSKLEHSNGRKKILKDQNRIFQKQ